MAFDSEGIGKFYKGRAYVCHQIHVISLYRKFPQNGTVMSSMLPAYRHHSGNAGISSLSVFCAAGKGHLRQGELANGYRRVCPEPA